MKLTILFRSVLFFIILKANSQELPIAQNKVYLKTLSQRWELNEEDKKGTFRIVSYKPFYFTAGRKTNNPNELPYSENPDNSATEAKPYNNYESRFQLSFKTKVLESFLFGTGDLWVGYTQIAHWQIYNTELSRPFRELNYEPELILNFPLNMKLLGFDLKMAGIGFNHQSNGRDLPRSRSWNRVMFNIAMERKNLIINLKPWIRLKDEIDENPLITSYVGRVETFATYQLKKHIFHVIATNSLSLNDNHGSLQFNYIYPLKANISAQLQFFNGYGETLIDYNHKQTTVGIGISFTDW
jgi:phospholipase A1